MKNAAGGVSAVILAATAARGFIAFPPYLDKLFAVCFIAFGAGILLYMWRWERS